MSANEKWQLTDSEILKAVACVHPNYILGCRAGRATRFAVIDIDAGSKYHNQEELIRLINSLEVAGIGNSSLYQSSDSGGWHLYVFFNELISSRDLRNQLTQLLKLNDFELAKGTLEIFPHPGDGHSKGQGLRLPLQEGFAELNPATLKARWERWELSPEKAICYFLDALENESNSRHDFHRMKAHVAALLEKRQSIRESVRTDNAGNHVIPIRRIKESNNGHDAQAIENIFGFVPPGINTEVWLKGRDYFEQGLSGPAQRADAIFCLGHYLFYGDPQTDRSPLGYGYAQERQWAIEQILHDKHNNQSKDLTRGRHDAIAQIHRAAHWIPPHKRGVEPARYEPHAPIAWIRENANRNANARRRITEALEALKKRTRSFTTVELQQTAGCSRATLYKNADIWRNDYENLAQGLFAICTDEYNAVVGAGCSETKLPAVSLEPNMVPERLAARRIAYEITMRAEREKKQAEQLALRSHESFEEKWLCDMKQLMERDFSSTSIQELKALLTVLAAYLLRAPNEECQLIAQKHIEEIKCCLVPSQGSIYLVRPQTSHLIQSDQQ